MIDVIYLIISTAHKTFSDTFLETLPKPLKNFVIPVRPILAITIRSPFLSVAYSNILSVGIPLYQNLLGDCNKRVLGILL